MNNFNDRVYLLLTLRRSELQEYYFQSIAIIIALAAYNLISVFFHTPALISYWAIAIALAVVTTVFLYLGSNSLSIDWDLLDRVEAGLKADAKKPKVEAGGVAVAAVVAEVAEISSNEEIQMVEPDEFDFDFGDSLASLYKTGTSQQLANSAVNGVEQKVRRMNLG